MNKLLYFFFIFVIFGVLSANVMAANSTNSTIPDFNRQITPQDKAIFDGILEPFFKIYNMLRYIAFAAAGIAMLYAAFLFMGSGSDISKREKAKAVLVGTFIGLVLMLGFPFIFEYLVS